MTYVTLQGNDLVTMPLTGEPYSRHPLPADRYFEMLIGDGDGAIYALENVFNDEGTMDDVRIVKLSTSGEILDEIGEPLPEAQKGHQMIRSPQGDFVILGKTPDPSSKTFVPWVAQFSKDGRLDWQVAPLDPSAIQVGDSIVALPGGDYLSLYEGEDSSRPHLLWISSEGDYISDDSPPYGGFDLAAVFDNGYITVTDNCIARIGEVGEPIWTVHPSATITDRLWTIESAGDETYIIAGVGEIPDYKSYIYLTQIQVTGAVLWERYYYLSGSTHQEVHTALPTPDGGYLIIGKFESYCYDPGCHGPYKSFAYKTDAQGHGPAEEVTP